MCSRLGMGFIVKVRMDNGSTINNMAMEKKQIST